MKDLGAVTNFVGLTIQRDRQLRTLSISQPDFTQKILDLYLENKQVKRYTPSAGQLPVLDKTQPLHDCSYMEAVGSLNYLVSWNRPDLAYTTSILSQFLPHPQATHWNAVQEAYQYLNFTKSVPLVFGANSNSQTTSMRPQLTGFSDADYAKDNSSSKSRTGCLIQ